MTAGNARRIIVVGGLAAGPSAAAKAARTNPNAEVILLEATDTVSYGICESPYLLGGSLPAEERLVSYTPERLRDEKRVDVRTLHYVEQISPARRTVTVRNLRKRGTEELRYDKLILATGASPRRLSVQHEDARNVFQLHLRADVLALQRMLETELPENVAIIGGGYIGMEMAEAFTLRGCRVSVLHNHALPLTGADEAGGERALEELENHGVQFFPQTPVTGLVAGKDSRVSHVLTRNGSIPCGLVLVAAGLVPNAGLARAARLRLGPIGGILTDRRQQTSRDDIYAAGDCCELKNLITGKPFHLPLATVASKTGWVAGENAAGGRALFDGAIRAAGVRIFDLEVAVVGLTAREATAAGFTVIRETITAYEKIALFPDAQKITIVLLADKRGGRVLGATLFGRTGAVHRANTLSAAIHGKATLEDLSRFDLVYAPPYAPLRDPLLIAAQQLKKKM